MGLRSVIRRIRGGKQGRRERVGLFVPGQSFQRVGMGLEEDGSPIRFLREVTEAVASVIEPIQVRRVERLMLVKPSELSPEEKDALRQEINRTDNAQLSLFLLSAALWKEYQEDEKNPMPSVVLGHSAGEPIAGHIAGALSLESAAKYIFARGAYMNVANSLFRGGMAMVSLKDEEVNLKAIEKCLKGSEVEIGNINTPQRIVLSGSFEELKWASEKIKEKGFRVAPLDDVAGAYHHSRAMASVKKALEELFSSGLVTIRPPAIPWILNFSGQPEDDEKKLRVYLPAQVSSTVMWRKSIETALDLGITKFVELGPGQGLINMLKQFPEWQENTIQDKEPGT